MADTSRSFLECIIDVPTALSEIAGMLAENAGAKGVEMRDETTLTPSGGTPVTSGRCHVLAWMHPDTDREALSSNLLARLELAWQRSKLEGAPALNVSFMTVDAEDWVQKVRDAIHPVTVGRRILVRPSWSPPSTPHRKKLVEIVLDPGLAFGTGHHATTVLCLEALEKMLDTARAQGFAPRVLDLGSGSGILAIAAAMLGARHCVGIDNDPLAVTVGNKNVRDNGVADRVRITRDQMETLDERFEIVVDIIHLGTLIELAGSATQRLAPGGHLLLSGLLEDQADAAEAVYASHGLEPRGRQSLEGWVLLSMVQRG